MTLDETGREATVTRTPMEDVRRAGASAVVVVVA
jgi:hypothetical protein